jgi:hypothetical protein
VLSRQGWKDATERKKTLDEKTARIREEEERKEYVFVRANRAKRIHKDEIMTAQRRPRPTTGANNAPTTDAA